MGFGEHQVGLGGLLGWIFGFWGFLSFLCLILFFFEVILRVLWSPLCFVVFSLVVKLNGKGLWVLRRSGEFRVVLVGIS